MKIAVFSTKSYDRRFFDAANSGGGHRLIYFEERLSVKTTLLARGFRAVCVFVNDSLDRNVLAMLSKHGTDVVALRCAGFNNVDLEAAKEFGIEVVRVPAYSPKAVSEHTLALIMSLNRKTYRAHNRIREGNFSLEGLLGFEVHEKTVGIIGTGRIGQEFAKLMKGFGCEMLAFDPAVNAEVERLGVKYVSLDELLRGSDIISLHCPLLPGTHHMIDAGAIAKMRDGVMLINTSRGRLVDTRAVIEALKSGKIAYLGLDVYEEEGDMFFRDLSNNVIQDDVFARLLTFPNVIITGHQAFFTDTALRNIAETTLGNISDIEGGHRCENIVTAERVRS